MRKLNLANFEHLMDEHCSDLLEIFYDFPNCHKSRPPAANRDSSSDTISICRRAVSIPGRAVSIGDRAMVICGSSENNKSGTEHFLKINLKWPDTFNGLTLE